MPKIMEKLRTIFEYKFTNDDTGFFCVVGKKTLNRFLGTVLFSFSIYLSVSLDVPALVKITPLGRMTIMAAWILLLVTGVFEIKKL